MKKSIIKKILLLGLSLTILMLFACNKRTVKMPFSAKECINKPYKEIEANFIELGFSNVQSVGVEDIKLGILAKEDMVLEVSIGYDSKFKKGDIVESNKKVVIKYHTRKNTN